MAAPARPSVVNKSPAQEFVVNVPKLSDVKKHSVMKFNLGLGVDFTNWDNEKIEMHREDNRTVWEQQDTDPEFGAGSEYGKAQRMELRRKKLGLVKSRYNLDAQPWRLEIGGKTGRNFKGIREGGAGQNADYWIFKKTGDGKFDALPIEEWYNFMPIARYKTLDIDEAEEQFEQRNKIMNQFALKAQILKSGNVEKLEDGGATTSSKQMKISDRDEYASDESDDEDADEKRAVKEEAEESKTKGKKAKQDSKGKKGSKKGKKQKKEEEDGEDPSFDRESEDGEEEGREVDYMSDSGSESDPMEAPEEEKVDEKGVNDESGLRRLLSDNEEDEEEEEEEIKTETQNLPDGKSKEANGDKESDSEGSDSDDPDVVDVKSAVFLQDKAIKAGSEKRSLEDSTDAGPSAKKPKHNNTDSSTSRSHPSGITEDDVRRYLTRKPMTTKELLAKLKPKAKDLSKELLVKRLADIMKQLNPNKEKVERKGKSVLVFSLSG